ncbi:sugar transferase [soil metagenome]
MVKRCFDLCIALPLFIICIPLFLIIALIIKTDSTGPVFYQQERIGRNKIPFFIYKFRTMFTGASKSGLLTVGGRDPRVTKSGYLLRKYKLDELPQLLNVIQGEMSLVGPRPEVQKYVDLYSPEQLQILLVKPGITDYASLEYSNENEILALSSDPESTYIREIMPAKLKLNLKYIKEKGINTDIKIILMTIRKVITGR